MYSACAMPACHSTCLQAEVLFGTQACTADRQRIEPLTEGMPLAELPEFPLLIFRRGELLREKNVVINRGGQNTGSEILYAIYRNHIQPATICLIC